MSQTKVAMGIFIWEENFEQSYVSWQKRYTKLQHGRHGYKGLIEDFEWIIYHYECSIRVV